MARAGVSAASGSEADMARRSQEIAELEEESTALRGQVGQNLSRMSTLIQELPSRIISIERLQILRLTLQNIALHVQRRERELQMHTVRRVLLRTDEKADEPSALMVQAMSKVEALLPHATPPLPARTIREETLREVLEACSVSYGVSS